MTINNYRHIRVEKKLKRKLFGDIENSFDLVETLKKELLQRNPGSHIDIKLEPDSAF